VLAGGEKAGANVGCTIQRAPDGAPLGNKRVAGRDSDLEGDRVHFGCSRRVEELANHAQSAHCQIVFLEKPACSAGKSVAIRPCNAGASRNKLFRNVIGNHSPLDSPSGDLFENIIAGPLTKNHLAFRINDRVASVSQLQHLREQIDCGPGSIDPRRMRHHKQADFQKSHQDRDEKLQVRLQWADIPRDRNPGGGL
jgi:hypothetical protein